MKTCKTCGRAVGEWKFCRFCGTKLDSVDLSFQKTSTLLRQNVILSDDQKQIDVPDDSSRSVPEPSGVTQAPDEIANIQGEKEKALWNETVYDIPQADAPPESASEDPPAVSKEYAEESDESRSELSAEKEVSGTGFQADDDEKEELSLTGGEEQEPVGENGSEVPLDLGSLFGFASPRQAERVADDDPESVPEPDPERTREESMGQVEELSFTNEQPFNEIVVTDADEDASQKDIITENDADPQEETINAVPDNEQSETMIGNPIKVDAGSDTGGFSAVDFESIDAAGEESVFLGNDADHKQSDCIPDIADSIPGETAFLTEGNDSESSIKEEREPRSFDDTFSEAKPKISAADIDPMFGAAPTFDVDSIMASCQTSSAKEKDKTKKKLFSRKKK